MSEHGFTFGVEEEYQIVDPATRELKARAHRILPEAREAVGDRVQPELYLSQIEIGTPVCRTLAELREALVHLRREVAAAAESEATRIAAAGTHPFSHWEQQRLTPKDRYLDIAKDYAQLAREQLIFGCHVHVGMPSREAGIQVMNRVRPWLPTLLALAANSPFWLGVDTGYASFRTEIWRRWPMSGTPQLFASRDEYDALVASLVETGAITDASKIYWDVRPSAKYETIEFRVADVCLTVDEAVLVAALCRALARRCHAEAERDAPVPDARPELIRAAKWRAARFGLDEELIDVVGRRAAPAWQVVERLLDFVRDELEAAGEWDEVAEIARTTLFRGNGASRQRDVHRERGSLEDVVDFVVAETA
jgi:carboxylate-amine ligase